MIITIKQPFTYDTVRRVTAMKHLGNVWEFEGEAREVFRWFRGLIPQIPGNVWIVTETPPHLDDTRRARTMGVVGWIWTKPQVCIGRAAAELEYKCRICADDWSVHELALLAQALMARGQWLEPYWINPSEEIDWRISDAHYDIPAGLLHAVNGNVPVVRCGVTPMGKNRVEGSLHLLSIEISGDRLLGCPYRSDLEGTTEPSTKRALAEVKAETFPCPHGCYHASVYEAAGGKYGHASGPRAQAELDKLTSLSKLGWFRVLKLVPRGLRRHPASGSTFPARAYLRRMMLMALHIRSGWAMNFERGSRYHVERWWITELKRVGALAGIIEVLTEEWEYAGEADWDHIRSFNYNAKGAYHVRRLKRPDEEIL